MPNQPKTPNRGVRVPDELWDEAKRLTAANHTTLTDVIRAALERYIREYGAS